MAAIFTLAFCGTVFALVIAVGVVVAGWRGRPAPPSRALVLGGLPVVAVLGVLLAYLLAKVAYEELYPCLAIDRFYCDFAATQYHNLFGWEF